MFMSDGARAGWRKAVSRNFPLQSCHLRPLCVVFWAGGTLLCPYRRIYLLAHPSFRVCHSARTDPASPRFQVSPSSVHPERRFRLRDLVRVGVLTYHGWYVTVWHAVGQCGAGGGSCGMG